MKKYLLYSIVGLSLSFMVISCGDGFVTVQPPSTVPVDGYYVTEAAMTEAAVAAYAPMGWFDYCFGQYSSLNLVSDIQGDDIYPGGGGEGDNPYLHFISEYKSTPIGDQITSQNWSGAYSGVNRSIHLIDYANNPNARITDEQRAEFLAEGHALRDYYYLVLWKNWGNIPYYEENLTMKTDFLAAQISADEVYENVVADLETAIDGNALPMKQANAQLYGRMTKATAEMMYADMVMYQNDQTRYAKALGYMKEIINSGQYSLVANYNDLFEQATEWTDEIIMDVNYIAKGGQRSWGNSIAAGGTVLPALIGVDGLNYNYLGSGHKAEFDGTGWGFAVVAKEAYDAYDPADKRRDVSVLNISQYMKDRAQGGNFVKDATGKWVNDAGGDIIYYGGRYQNTGFFLRKYLGRDGGNAGALADAALNFGNNLHLYRYSETLLNAAELALNAGDAAFAQQCLDQVRTRAGLGSIPATLDNIIQERRFEFIGEGKRYYDLVRTGKAVSVLVPGGGVLLDVTAVEPTDPNNPKPWDGKHIGTTPLVYTATGTANPLRIQWTEDKKYLPIPQGEMDNTKDTDYPLVQNPY